MYRRSNERALGSHSFSHLVLPGCPGLSHVNGKDVTQRRKHQVVSAVPQPNFLGQVLQRLESSGISSSGTMFILCQGWPDPLQCMHAWQGINSNIR